MAEHRKPNLRRVGGQDSRSVNGGTGRQNSRSSNDPRYAERPQRSVTRLPAVAGTQPTVNQPRRRPASTEIRRPNRGLLGGCGLLTVVIALLLIIALVGFLVSGLASKNITGPERITVPDDVPPAAGKPAPNIDIHREGRTALQLSDWAAPISKDTGIPMQAMMAYGNAEVIARETRPACGIRWTTLAGLGYVETVHGTYDGKRYGASKLDRQGYVQPGIFGPQLNGDGFAVVRDTDGGKMDGDEAFDRAMGPLQFIPESWERYGVDANGDGRTSPQNIDDAAASAVRLLCDYNRDLNTPDGWTRAVRSYNQSDEYVINVRDAAANYALNQPPLQH